MFAKPKMPHNKPAPKLNQRIAEEAQLLLEERWIIATLKKIKSHLNGLQIERLQLESMRAKIIANPANPSNLGTQGTSTSTNNYNEMLDALVNSIPLDTTVVDNANEVRQQSNINEEDLCNFEELNLAVTDSVFTAAHMTEDEEEDEDDIEDCVLDIDLLMSGK